MFHPISPVSGTDGKMNLSENAATRPDPMRENTSALLFGIQEPFRGVRSVAES
jgi:hypothetical protein